MYAFEGMRLIAANIVNAVKDGKNIEAREKVAMGSLLGGFCLGPCEHSGSACTFLSIGKYVSPGSWLIQCIIITLCNGIQYSCCN
jgi:hypothetical protein